MLPILNSKINFLINKQLVSSIRLISCTKMLQKSETSRLIDQRNQEKLNKEMTTGFDKFKSLNEYHLSIMKKYDTPEIERKRNLNFISFLFKIVSVGVFGTIVGTIIFHLFVREFDV